MVGVVVLLVTLVVAVVLGTLYSIRSGRVRTGAVVATPESLTAERIGQPLGSRATLVQFSSAFCAPCRATRTVLTGVAAELDGVEAVDVDAESHLDLVRELGIVRTPTTFVLDGRGHVVARAGGVPHRDQVRAAVAAIDA